MSEDNHEEIDFCFRACNREELATAWPGQCVYVVEEIISTEQSYVSDLENIVKVCVVFFCFFLNHVCLPAVDMPGLLKLSSK